MNDHYISLPDDPYARQEAIIQRIGYAAYLNLVGRFSGAVAHDPIILGDQGGSASALAEAAAVASQAERRLTPRDLAGDADDASASILVSVQHIAAPVHDPWPGRWLTAFEEAARMHGVFDRALLRELHQHRDWRVSFHLDWYLPEGLLVTPDMRVMEENIIYHLVQSLKLHQQPYGGCVSIPLYGDFSQPSVTVVVCVEARIA